MSKLAILILLGGWCSFVFICLSIGSYKIYKRMTKKKRPNLILIQGGKKEEKLYDKSR